MSKAKHRLRPERRSKIESLEDRLAMSADPLSGALGGPISHHGFVDEASEQQVAPPLSHHTQPAPDFWLDPIENQSSLDDLLGGLEQTLFSAHNTTGLNDVRQNYGFRGGGQTVAIIDSGIAYDHFALGGGFGEDYRVVGGYDFTGENDADPYDDGPSGSHGTHVAGIVGSSDSREQGVAPDVDLVGLRVFDDDGAGFFSWVENALDWVYANRNTFENPITTVNLSLGTNWNSDSIPAWANLEDEFAQLEAAGIFISVSAGNSFQSYNTPGLSYPAASPHVVPVASVDDSGILSFFSQRNQRVIAAPGRAIRSTVPDYAGNNNGVADDFATFSGTSMAAPYVAGASVLVREAMQFVGYTNITQDDIYDHLIATADTIFDSATGLEYSRLNLGRAIDALLPADDFGSDLASAFDLGTVNAGLSQASASDISGVISTLDDGDYFTFTAGSTGTVTFTATNTTHDLAASWVGDGGNGWAGADGQSYTIEVVAGQQYTIGLSSTGGLGYYDLAISAEAAFTFTDWGAIAGGQQTQTGLTAGAETWYRIVAAQDGFVTADALYDAGVVDIALYNADLNLIVDGAATDRVDVLTTAGTELFLRVEGDGAGLDLRLTNLVSVSGSTITVGGTTGDDTFAFAAGEDEHSLSVNGLEYTFDAAAVDTAQFDAGAGADTVVLTGTSGNESATLRAGQAELSAASYQVAVVGAEDIALYGGGGDDEVVYYDSTGDDIFIGRPNRSTLRGDGYQLAAWGFSDTDVFATTGNDRATFYDSLGDDWFIGEADRARMWGSGYHHDLHGFDYTITFSSGGYDQATFRDTDGDDVFVGWSDRALMTGDGYYHDTRGFERVTAFATTGDDRAVLHDSLGDDTYVAWSDRALLTGDGFYNDTRGFALQEAYATEGYDRSVLHDSAGDDVFVARPGYAQLSGADYINRVWGFERNEAYATTGYDRAELHDSAGDDLYVGRSGRVRLRGDSFHSEAIAFDYTTAFATTGNDSATFYDTAGDDTYVAWSGRALITGDGYYNDTRGFNYTIAFATEGNDRAVLHDTAGDDTYVAWSNRALLTGSGFYNDTRGFDRTEAYATDGFDRAVLHDSTGDDEVHAQAARAYLEGVGFRNEGYRFDEVAAHSTQGGDDSQQVDTIDYLFSLIGQWS